MNMCLLVRNSIEHFSKDLRNAHCVSIEYRANLANCTRTFLSDLFDIDLNTSIVLFVNKSYEEVMNFTIVAES